MKALELLNEIETDLLNGLMDHLTGGNIGSAEWQLSRMQLLGRLRNFGIETIKKRRPELIAAIKEELEYKAFRRVTMIDNMVDEKKLSAVLPASADPRIRGIVARWEARTIAKADTMFATMLNNMDAIYKDTVTKTALKVQLGVSGRKAIAETAKEWARTGIPALVDSAGRTWTPETYATAVIRTASTNSMNDAQLERMQELDEDLVEISSHLGSRPEHEEFQGKVFSISGKSTKYPPLYVTDYGTAGGIGGVNCRHVLYPYFEGTEKTFSPFPEKKNDKEYAQSQRQRALERGIRRAKRELGLMQKTGSREDIEQAKKLVSARQKAMREFVGENNRPREYGREQIWEA